MSRNVKATISFGDKSITFEGPADFVSQQVEKYRIARQGNQGDNQPPKQGKTASNPVPLGRGLPPAEDSAVRERALIELKKPKNHPETVAVLAFALAENGIGEFTEEDMHRAYLRGDVRPPKVIGQAIRDAKNNHDFIEVGSQRGYYRLSNHGDRTVRFDLPRSN
jgi:hypothetical protein